MLPDHGTPQTPSQQLKRFGNVIARTSATALSKLCALIEEI